MAIARFMSGQEMVIDGDVFELERQINENEWQFRSKNTGRYFVRSKKELAKLFIDGRLKFVNCTFEAANDSGYSGCYKEAFMALGILPDNMQSEAKIRFVYANAVIKSNLDVYTEETVSPIVEETYNKIQEKHKKPSWWSVNRWRKLLEEGGNDIRALVTRNSRKGNRKRRFERQFIELIERAIKEIYLTREKNTIEDTVDRATVLVKHENKSLPPSMHLPLPSHSLVRNEIYKIPEYDRVVARRGPEVAKRLFRTACGSIYAERPLERVEIDHTLLDILILDENLNPIGRPTLTVCIDVNTRSVLGIYIGFEPPSFVTVAQCLKHAFLPKVDLREQYPAVKNEWLQHGVMVTLVVDNGLEFHAQDLEALCYPFGITIQYTPRKTPWFKGIIERFIGTFNRGVCHGVPGTTFESILAKEDYDAAKNAVLTLQTFREIVHVWIVDYYHQRKHRALGEKPIEAWSKNIHEYEIPLPADIDDLDYLLGSEEKRVLSHKGIEFNSIRYNSEELGELRSRYRHSFKASIRYSKADLGFIHVIDPETDKPIRVPALDQAYANGLSEWQHKVCKRFARENYDRTDIEALAEAKQTIRELVENDLLDKRVKTRKRAYRFTHSANQEDPITSSEADSASSSGVENNHLTENTNFLLEEEEIEEVSDDRDEGALALPAKLKVVSDN